MEPWIRTGGGQDHLGGILSRGNGAVDHLRHLPTVQNVTGQLEPHARLRSILGLHMEQPRCL